MAELASESEEDADEEEELEETDKVRYSHA